MMKDWDVSVPCFLPRISSLRKCRNNTIPAKYHKPCLIASPLDFNARWSSWRRSDYFYPGMIPEPDYSESESREESDEQEVESEVDEDSESDYSSAAERLRDVEEDRESEEEIRKRMAPPRRSKGNTLAIGESGRSMTFPKRTASMEDDLIKPRKPTNPYLESMERRNLHKELVFKQKYGQHSVNQRSELQKALEKYTESKVKKDLAASRRSSLEKILEQQARKIEMHEREGTTEIRPAWIERLKRQHITKWIDPKKDEFYRVHAKVVGNFTRNHSADEESNHSSDSATSRKQESSPSDSED